MSSLSPDATIGRRVKDVVKIIGEEIGPDKVHKNVVEQAIRLLDAKTRHDSLRLPWPPWPQNKSDKKIAESLGLALARLEKRLGNYDVPEVLVRATYGEADEFLEWRTQLKHWRERFEAFSGNAQVGTGTLFDESRPGWPLGQPKPSTVKAARMRLAAKAAAEILESHGLRLTATRKVTGGKASLFCRVADAIFGVSPSKPHDTLYHQCRVFLKTRNRGGT